MGSTAKTLLALSIMITVASVLSIGFFVFVKHVDDSAEEEYTPRRGVVLPPVGERFAGRSRLEVVEDGNRSPAYYLRGNRGREVESAPPESPDTPTLKIATETSEPLGVVVMGEGDVVDGEVPSPREGRESTRTRPAGVSAKPSAPEVAIQSSAFPLSAPDAVAAPANDKKAVDARRAVAALAKALHEEADETGVVRYFDACRRGGANHALAAWAELQRMVAVHSYGTRKLGTPALEQNTVRFLAQLVAGLEWAWIEKEVLRPMIARMERHQSVRADQMTHRQFLREMHGDALSFFLAQPADLVASEVVWAYIASAGEVHENLLKQVRDLANGEGESGVAAREKALPWVGLLLARCMADPEFLPPGSNIKYSFPVGVLNSKRGAAYQAMAGAVFPAAATSSTKQVALAWWTAYEKAKKDKWEDAAYPWPAEILALAEWLSDSTPSRTKLSTDFRRLETEVSLGERPQWFLGSPANFRQLFRALYDRELAALPSVPASPATALGATVDRFRSDTSRHQISAEQLRGCADVVVHEFMRTGRDELEVTLDLAMLKVIWERAEDERFERVRVGRNASDRREWRTWVPLNHGASPLHLRGPTELQAFAHAAERHGRTGPFSASSGELASLMLQATGDVREALNSARSIRSRRGLGGGKWDQVVPLIRLVPQHSAHRQSDPWDAWVSEYVTVASEPGPMTSLKFARVAVLSHGARAELRSTENARKVWRRWLAYAAHALDGQESRSAFGGYVLAFEDLVYSGWNPIAALE